MSGTFLEQASLYQPEVIRALQELLDAGRQNRQVEYLEETYYHSLVSLFSDPNKKEFKDQVSLHRQKMKELFGIKPQSFRNTDLIYNNDLANVVADMGFKAILCEWRDDMFTPQDGKPRSPNAVFRAMGRKGRTRDLILIARNRNLSEDMAYRFGHGNIAPGEYAEHIARIDGEAVLLGCDYEQIGEHLWAGTETLGFWKGLAGSLSDHPGIIMANPTEIAERFKKVPCPVLDIRALSSSLWADTEKGTFGWLGTPTQYALFKDIEALEEEAHQAGGAFLNKWRHLTTSDHLYYVREGERPDHVVHKYFSPYETVGAATYLLTRNIDSLETAIRSFNVRKKVEQTPVIIIAP
jgi:alpha-amylase/alpha-mannosidase (GH57 family)